MRIRQQPPTASGPEPTAELLVTVLRAFSRTLFRFSRDSFSSWTAFSCSASSAASFSADS